MSMEREEWCRAWTAHLMDAGVVNDAPGGLEGLQELAMAHWVEYQGLSPEVAANGLVESIRAVLKGH